ncbi:hypothetical protein [Thalassorhabdomicrobium marinisediminis]|uniref:Succinate dehydrogenase n=1 Tax=Thalassorhabdomicrobium marinisediminis TaxID=2170577 RepID=A0A2T7FYF3_9RHOB|nr:hypothetical protein [Thalassorhabdomicrobium marinisediminis]PVA07194.1 hypothetical protein DC363_04905 [Thalassorhabdomicrobium marinisediminis]
MKTLISLTAAALTLAACDVAQVAAVDTGRAAAKAVIAPIVAETVPGAPGVILTNCIVDNATPQELIVIASGGATPQNVTLVGDILARPATVTCATAGLT